MFQLSDPISRPLNMRFLALRAATRPGKTLSTFKNISTFQATRREDNKLFPLRDHRACNMGEVLINLLFPDPEILRQLNRVHLHFTQKVDNSLPDRFHLTSLFDRAHPIFRSPVKRLQGPHPRENGSPVPPEAGSLNPCFAGMTESEKCRIFS